jgi:endo-alpha-1,4-polygalactosaminidase (GH114 family)
MTREEMEKRFDELHESDLALMKAKNHDYAGPDDPLDNLRDFGFVGVVVRMGDKFKRLKAFAKRAMKGEAHLAVKDESIRDTLRDMRIYATLAEIMLDEEAK